MRTKPNTGIIKESVLNRAINLYDNYDEYLDSMIIKEDLFYLEDLGFARKLVELAIINHSKSAIIPRKLFNASKLAQHVRRISHSEPCVVESQYSDLHDPLLSALWERQETNRKKTVLTIIFMRIKSPAGHEVSGYIDFSHRLETEDFTKYWSGKRHLQPRRNDLSYVAWRSQGPVCMQSSRNFIILPANRALVLQCRHDGRTLKLYPAMGSVTREKIPVIGSSIVLQVELIDHVVNRGSA